eukprot:353375-Chlamydomonas_euryale.AAC.13
MAASGTRSVIHRILAICGSGEKELLSVPFAFDHAVIRADPSPTPRQTSPSQERRCVLYLVHLVQTTEPGNRGLHRLGACVPDAIGRCLRWRRAAAAPASLATSARGLRWQTGRPRQ